MKTSPSRAEEAGAGAGRGPAAACIMYQPLPGLGVCYSGALSSSGYPHGRQDFCIISLILQTPRGLASVKPQKMDD